MTEPFEVAEVLVGSLLGGLPTGHGPGGTILIRDVPSAGLVDAWQAAYSAVSATGRWPVMVTDDWGDELRISSRRDPAAPTPADLLGLDQVARSRDPWASFPVRDDDVLAAEDTELVQQGISGPHLGDEVLREAPSPTTERQLGRWIYERVLADPGLSTEVASGVLPFLRTGNWYAPGRVSLLLLPTADPWQAPNWIDFFETDSRDLAAMLWQWHQRWDARLVACWGTMLQFLVRRRPAPGDEAWELAGQIKSLACSMDLQRWELAVGLSHADEWFIHCRP